MSEITPVFPENPNSSAALAGAAAIYLDTTISPSRQVLRWHMLAHLAVLGSLLLVSYFKVLESLWWGWLVLASFALVSAAWYWSRQSLLRTWHLRIDAGAWQLAPEGGDFEPVRVSGAVTVWRPLVSLSLRSAHGCTPLVLAADSMPADDYRRLRVWLLTQLQR